MGAVGRGVRRERREFAEQKQLPLATLQFWIYKLRRETKARFVPVAALTARDAARDAVEV